MKRTKAAVLVVLACVTCTSAPVLGQIAGSDLPSPAPARSLGNQKQVLALYSTRRDAQIAAIGDRVIPRTLEASLPTFPDYYSEYIDQARFPDLSYRQAFLDYLALKYQGHTFDVLLAIDSMALAFVTENRARFFPATPIVYFSSGDASTRPPNATGVEASLELDGTIDLALALQPDTQHIYVITGAEKSDQAYLARAQAQLRPFEARVSLMYLSGLSTPELETSLASLPEHSIVLYLLVSRDGAGVNVHPLDYLDRVVAASNSPTYCWVSAALDHGVLGGSLKDQEAETAAVARLAARVLNGEPADGIPIVTADLSTKTVDWRQLQRWGIDEALVPAGTRVLFREPGFWDRYRRYVLAGLALLLAQSALIAGLLVQARRRHLAEARLRLSENELRASCERIRNLGGRLLSAQEAERSRIARELHDDVSQQVALLAMDVGLLSGVASMPAADSPRVAREAFNRTQNIAKSLHDISHRLHPARLRLIGLVGAIDSLIAEFSRPRLQMTFTHDNVPATFPQDIALSLYRVVQEALANVVKHSAATAVSVQLSGRAGWLTLIIEDNGAGFDVNAAWGHGLGLISMSERLESIRGTLRIRSAAGSGTRLDISVPLAAGASHAAAS